MFEKIPSEKEAVNLPKYEHLNKGEKPIIASIGPRENLDEPTDSIQVSRIPEPKEGAHDVDYFADQKELEKRGLKHGGAGHAYVMSPIDDKDKFSKNFINCTGIVVAGREKQTGKDISFFAHLYSPSIAFKTRKRETFLSDLHEQMEEIKKRTEEGTIDATIFGGNYFSENDPINKRTVMDYTKVIEILSKELKKGLGFDPIIMTGPKTVLNGEDVYYDTANRRMHIVRPETGNSSTASYVAKDMETEKEKWVGANEEPI